MIPIWARPMSHGPVSFMGKSMSFRLRMLESRWSPFEIRTKEGKLDEIVGHPDHIHLEQMDVGHWWLGLSLSNGKTIHVYFFSKGKITAEVSDETTVCSKVHPFSSSCQAVEKEEAKV